LGNPKEKETLTGLLMNTRLLQLKMGRIDVRFQEPFSLKGYLVAERERRASLPIVEASTLLNSTAPQPLLAAGPIGNGQKTAAQLAQRAEQNIMLRALGYKILSDINKVSVIMPASLISTVMLTIRGRVSSVILGPTFLLT
jgi:glycerol-3-phosphate O-acyltransferase